MDNIKLNYDNISIVPEIVSNISHRSECNILEKYTDCDMMPIFTAPMDTVINEKNWMIYQENGINPILPRTVPIMERFRIAIENNIFAAISLTEAKNFYLEKDYYEYGDICVPKYICIDIANGHMKEYIDVVKKIKNQYKDNVIVMAGNIANPKTYKLYEEAGADYVRCGIGGGDACFIDGTKITMGNGERKNIEEVEIGEYVLTNDGTPHEVTDKTHYKTYDKILKINNEIECTDNHKFYVINKKDREKATEENIDKYAFWIEAKDIDKDIHYLLKIIQYSDNKYPIQFIEVESITKSATEKYVNDLTVDVNHSYIANNYIVHNCTTSSNTSIHYPYFSLMQETYNIKKKINGKCKIIADGNIKGYGDIQKALVFADCVMIGSLFNKSIESAAKTTYGKCYFNLRGHKIFRPIKTLICYGKEVNPREKSIVQQWRNGTIVLWKQFYGMSTKIAQKKMGNSKLKTAEGLVKYQKAEYEIEKWAENEKDYLKSALSYTNSKNLEEYKNSEYVISLTHRYNN